jgi:flagellar protein FliO/FliZ
MPPFDTIVLRRCRHPVRDRARLAHGVGVQDFRHRQPSARGFLRPRDKRLGVVETAAVDARRKLLLVRRDDVEHLIIVGGPVDMVIETGIKGRAASRAPLEDVIIAKSETRLARPISAKNRKRHGFFD